MLQLFVLQPQLTEKAKSSTPKEVLLANEYGRKDAVLDLADVVRSIHPAAKVDIKSISLDNYRTVIDEIAACPACAVLNLCDGTEEDGYPGLSIVKYLEQVNIPFTGSGSPFFEYTTSKPMLVDGGVPTAAFVEVDGNCIRECVEQAAKMAQWPLIVKPSVSYASLSISKASVVEDVEAAVQQVASVLQTTTGGVFLESFLAGREFTALCTGDQAAGVKVYTVAERVFHPALKERDKILAFDRYWDGYTLEGGQGSKTEMYWYAPAPEEWQEGLSKVARDAYLACQGSGYGRGTVLCR
ncbi:hypothetical protein HDU91_007210 [Kappamyces sp. JEL0680]|nr:hypothetical protein HDU91_007210 [Kappamyces sp. JEL0680]